MLEFLLQKYSGNVSGICEVKVTYSQVWWPILRIRALHLPIQVHTHTAVNTHTHREHTPRAVGTHLCCGAWGAVGGSVPCSRTPSWYWRWREHCTFTPPPTIPAGTRLKLTNFRLWVRTIRPWFPHDFPLYDGCIVFTTYNHILNEVI